MIEKNRNFEEFMDFRDMIQSGALNDRIKMVQSMSEKPVMAMDEGGSLNAVAAKEKEKRIASAGDSLAEVWTEAYMAKSKDSKDEKGFEKYYEQEAKLAKGADLISGGLASMPVVEASFGGFLKDTAINVGKAFLGDIAGEAIGTVAQSFDETGSGIGSYIADALDTSAGKALVGAGTSALIDYGLNEFFDYGEGPNIVDFGADFGFRFLSDYLATPKEERGYGFGTLGLDEKEDEAKIKAILDAQKQRRSDRQGDQDFFGRVVDYSRLGEAFKNPTRSKGVGQILARSFDPIGKGITKAALAVPEGQQAQAQGVQSIQPNRFVPRLSREVGGLRGITVPAKVDRSELNQRQVRELGTRGETIHKGKRITKQDLVGRTEYARRTKPLATAATGGLVSLRDNGGPVVSDAQKAYMNWLDSVGGPSALSKKNLQRRTIDEVITDYGPEYFSYDQGDSRGAGLYDDFALDMADFPFAYPEHPDFRRLNALRGGPREVSPRIFRSLQKMVPSDSNREFVLRLLGLQEDDDLIEANQGGSLMGDQFSGMVGGDGHGMEDNVQMPIVSDGEQVATLAVSPKEYVVDAYTMSALGNGNADEGAKIMDETIKSIRRKAYGTNKQPNEIDGSKALRSGLRSIA